METAKTRSEIIDAIESFLARWDRQMWMQDNGEWASSYWDERRAEYTEALEAMKSAIASAPDPEDVGSAQDDDALERAMESLQEAISALTDQVRPDESDYIAEGIIDPDDVRGGAVDLGLGRRGQDWDCVESWDAYRHGDALAMRWYRAAYGDRRHRDLWVVVDAEFFGADNDD